MERKSNLSKVPLIINPSLRPPQAVTLPFNYNRLPREAQQSAVKSQTLDQIQSDSQNFINTITDRDTQRTNAYNQWIEKVRSNEIEEKRRIAPGYLDSSHKILQPTRRTETTSPQSPQSATSNSNNSNSNESELDQVFGKVSIN